VFLGYGTCSFKEYPNEESSPRLSTHHTRFLGPFQSLIACRRACKTPAGEGSRFYADIKNHVMHCAIMQGICTIKPQCGREPPRRMNAEPFTDQEDALSIPGRR